MLRDCIHSDEIGTATAIMGQYQIFQIGRTAGFKTDLYTHKPEIAACYPGKSHFALSRLAACGEAPKLRPWSYIEIGHCYNPLGVILNIYTTKNLRIFPKTSMSFASL